MVFEDHLLISATYVTPKAERNKLFFILIRHRTHLDPAFEKKLSGKFHSVINYYSSIPSRERLYFFKRKSVLFCFRFNIMYVGNFPILQKLFLSSERCERSEQVLDFVRRWRDDHDGARSRRSSWDLRANFKLIGAV